MSQELIDLGNRIRERRQEVGLSQEVLAEQAGISPNTISRIECGQTAMSVETFQKLVRILGSDANWLLSSMESTEKDTGQLHTVICRVRNLKQAEQDIVVRTMKALMDGLEKTGEEYFHIYGVCFGNIIISVEANTVEYC
ncbi:helix-turn-helix domain-containing protein [Lacrimispora xylanisolvens]|uniref:helix-turn-helix domain-containing protein n=1 Tax=Lacrimispora xylanisolvens TaxID=384636 RepID=UPI00240279AE